MPRSQLPFLMRQLLFCSRENKAVNGAKASHGLSAEPYWPAHLVREGDDTAGLPDTHFYTGVGKKTGYQKHGSLLSEGNPFTHTST